MSEIATKKRVDVRLLILALIALHLAFALFVNRPGYTTWDSGTYHLMAKNFAQTGGFVFDNAYDELPSPALAIAQLRAPQGMLVSQYPETYTVLVLPFYLLMGYPGLIFLNVLCFAAIALLLYRLAMRLFGDPSLALVASAIYAFATYAWEWSFSPYPHLSSTLLLLGAVYGVAGIVFGDVGSGRPADERGWLPALCAGFAVGLAVGLRLDSIFILPGLVLPLALARPVRWRALVALAAGLLPGLLFLSLTNLFKFGTANPFSYGIVGGRGLAADLGHYLPAALIGLALALALLALRWQMARPDAALRLGARWRSLALAGLVVLGLGVALVPERALSIVNGSFQILIDLRVRPEITEPALTRSDGGAMIYMDATKKALLQSCPWLILLPLGVLGAARLDQRWRIAFLAFLPLPFFGVFGSLAWHGSVALNMRYLNPVLPWLALLAAWLWMRLPERPTVRRAWTIAALSFAFFAIVVWNARDLEAREMVHLSLPLVVAAVLLVVDLARRWRPEAPALHRLLPRLWLVSFAFAAALVFFGDYPDSARYRSHFTELTHLIEPHIETPAVLFCDAADVMWGLLDRFDDLVLARPGNDEYETFLELTYHHLDAGRRVYVHADEDVVQDLFTILRSTDLAVRMAAETPPIEALKRGVLLELASTKRPLPATAE